MVIMYMYINNDNNEKDTDKTMINYNLFLKLFH